MNKFEKYNAAKKLVNKKFDILNSCSETILLLSSNGHIVDYLIIYELEFNKDKKQNYEDEQKIINAIESGFCIDSLVSCDILAGYDQDYIQKFVTNFNVDDFILKCLEIDNPRPYMFILLIENSHTPTKYFPKLLDKIKYSSEFTNLTLLDTIIKRCPNKRLVSNHILNIKNNNIVCNFFKEFFLNIKLPIELVFNVIEYVCIDDLKY